MAENSAETMDLGESENMRNVKGEQNKQTHEQHEEEMESSTSVKAEALHEQTTSTSLQPDPSRSFQVTEERSQSSTSSEVKSAAVRKQLLSEPNQAVCAEDIHPPEAGISDLSTADAHPIHSDDKTQHSSKNMAKNSAESLDLGEEYDDNFDVNDIIFPQTLEEFGYRFNEEGELRTVDGDEPFQFVIREYDREYNQRRYEALGEIITQHIYTLLEKASLKRIFIPIDAKGDEPRGFFFMSPEAEKKETLLLLIHGSGVVRAGQWSRKLIINNDLKKGTQLPYIEFGLKQGFGVVVLNTNQNRDEDAFSYWNTRQIRGSESPERHALYVWDHFLENSAVTQIAVVAHSYGGVVTSLLSDQRPAFRKRVFAIAFTDSVHGYGSSSDTKNLFEKCAVNWVSSSSPLDTVLTDYGTGKRRSAGHPVHEWSSYAAMGSVFKYILEKHEEENKEKHEAKQKEKHEEKHEWIDKVPGIQQALTFFRRHKFWVAPVLGIVLIGLIYTRSSKVRSVYIH